MLSQLFHQVLSASSFQTIGGSIASAIVSWIVERTIGGLKNGTGARLLLAVGNLLIGPFVAVGGASAWFATGNANYAVITFIGLIYLVAVMISRFFAMIGFLQFAREKITEEMEEREREAYAAGREDERTKLFGSLVKERRLNPPTNS